MKRVKRIKLLILALVFSLTAILPLQAQSAYADPLGSSTVYPVSDKGEGVALDKTGNVWVSSYGGGLLKMSPDGTTAFYSGGGLPGGFSKSIAVDAQNNVWTTDGMKIGKVSQAGTITSYTIPSAYQAGSYPQIYTGVDGNMWFVAADGSAQKSHIGRITPDGTFLPFIAIDGIPAQKGLVADYANNVMWSVRYPFSSGGGSQNQTIITKIVADGTQTDYVAPASLGRAGSLSIGPDGNVWYAGSYTVGKMTPAGSYAYYNLPLSSSAVIMQFVSGVDGYLWAMLKNGKLERISTSGVGTMMDVFPAGTVNYELTGMTAGLDGNIWLSGNIGANKKIVKFGTGFTDSDQDGLQYSQEIAQGTVDNNPDYDGDGLSDYVESTSYTARGSVFCDQAQTTCEYPDPLAKDIYVESDWMDKPGANGYSMQLSNTQVQSIKDSFDDKNITLHIDTGQLGGGSEVPYNANIYYGAQANSVDFYDYKLGGNGITAQFAPDRRDIYHYMISGDSYRDDATGQPSLSSGGSYTGDDDFFVSYGYIKENMQSEYSTLDTAISGTTMHELGHGLCLSKYNNGNPEYPGQPADCRFAGVDASFGSTYNSVMNYDMQFSIVDYSDGILGAPNDHNDWNAIRLADFNKHNIGDWQHGVSTANPTFKAQKTKQNVKKPKLNVGPTLKQLRNPQR